MKGKIIATLMAICLASTAFAGGALAVGTVSQNATDGTTSGGLDLADGETTTIEGDVSTTNNYTVRVKDSGGTLLAENTGVAPSSGAVSTSFNDSNILNASDGTERVSEGDVLTIEYYDESGAAVEYTADVTVEETADGYAAVDSSLDSVEVTTQSVGGLPYVGLFGEDKQTASFATDVALNDDKDQQTLNIDPDSSTASALDARATEVSDGELMTMDVDSAEGPVPVFKNNAGENASEYDTYAVYDTSNSVLEVTTNNTSLNSMTFDIDTSEGISVFESDELPTVSAFDLIQQKIPMPA